MVNIVKVVLVSITNLCRKKLIIEKKNFKNKYTEMYNATND